MSSKLPNFAKVNEIPILEICDLLGINYHSCGNNEYRARSIFDEGHNNTCLSIDTSKNVWHDFKSGCENIGGGPLNLYAFIKYGSYNDNDALIKAARELLGEDDDDAFDVEYKKQRDKEKTKFLAHINSAHDFLMNSNEESAVYTRDYLHERGITDETIKRFKLGVALEDMFTTDTETGQDTKKCSEYRLIMPYLNEQGQPFYSLSRDLPKYQQPRKDKIKYKKISLAGKKFVKNGLYGLSTIPIKNRDCEQLIICEGAIDALCVTQSGYSVLCSAGGHFSKALLPQVIKIAKKFRNITFCFDSDEAGYGFAYSLGESFVKEHINFTVVNDYGKGNKDINDYFSEGGSISELLSNAKIGFLFMAEQFINMKYDGLQYQSLSTNDKEKFSKDMRIFVNIAMDVLSKQEYEAVKSVILSYYPEKLLKKIENGQTQKEKIIELRDAFLNTHDNILHFGTKKGGMYYEYDKSGYWRNITDATLESEISALTGNTELPATLETVSKAVTTCIHVKDRPEFNKKQLRSFTNGTLELETGIFREHRADDELTAIATYPYDTTAKCDKFMKFLEEVTDGDNSRKKFLQQMSGYVLVSDCRFAKMFFLIGEGRNGKSVFLSILEALFKNGNKSDRMSSVTHIQPKDLKDANQRAFLADSILNIAADIDSRLYGNESEIKSIVAGDKISANFKYGDTFSFETRAKLIMSTNHMPKLRDTSEGMRRRPMFCKFVVDFKGREDVTLKDKIIADELSGIFNWCYQGYKDIIAQGFISECIDQRESLENFEEIANPILAFWQDYHEEQSEGEYLTLYAKELFMKYREWCKENNKSPVDNKNFQETFLKTLEQLDDVTITKSRKRENGKQPYIYKITLSKVVEGTAENAENNIAVDLTQANLSNTSYKEIQQIVARQIPDFNQEKIHALFEQNTTAHGLSRAKAKSACEIHPTQSKIEGAFDLYDEHGEISGYVINGVYKAS